MSHSNYDKRILKEPDFILLNINAALVILGYGLAIYTESASLGFMKVLKSFFMALSVIYVFRNLRLQNKSIPTPSIIYLFVLAFWVMFMSFFTTDVKYSSSKALNFLAPFIYVYLALHNLLSRYHVITVLRAFIRGMNLIYFIPIFAYLISGAGFRKIDIYGTSTAAGQLFVSNHYGWASCIFLLTSIDILLSRSAKGGYRLFLSVFSLIAIYIVIVSGNRASWLSLLLAIVIFILRLKTIRADFKITLALIPVIAIIFFSKMPESAINVRMKVTESQLEEGEARFNTAKIAIDRFNEDKIMWLTGAGMFNYEEIIHGAGLTDYHNSYLEVLFGGGIILFLLFINFMVLRPVYNYATYYSKYFIVFPPLLIIPFFESNITGGQFLFFPWFIFMLLFNMTPAPQKAAVKSVQVPVPG